MDGDPAAPTEDKDNAPGRDSPARDSAPLPPQAEEPGDQSGAGSDLTDAAGTASRSTGLRRVLIDLALALWLRTAPLRRKLRELWRSTIDALRETGPVSGATSAPSAPSGPLTERLDTPVPIRVSGQGRTFNFHIHARCVWSSWDLHREALLSYAHYYLPDAVRKLTRLAAKHAADFPAHRAAELEVALERALSETGPWRYQRGDTLVTCQPHVSVDVDERVRKVVLPYWEKLVKLDCEFDLDRRRAEYADRLGRQRATGAENVTDGAAAGEAARTTGENRAGDVRRMAAELRAAAQRLEDVLRRTPRDDDSA
ncbi:hypothetical protein [Micromonospora sp. RTP1Z1]|uniref:hypothetical protein n=1 Tax=Micromonospora sp. RTP1Z1 TaxID=2994043 RepID=UPI0029C7054D|nr:hypothetical protein [Micromonospora sp. RTP1Z1]